MRTMHISSFILNIANGPKSWCAPVWVGSDVRSVSQKLSDVYHKIGNINTSLALLYPTILTLHGLLTTLPSH